MENASKIKCICLTVIIENIIYLVAALVTLGFTWDYMFILMIIEFILFGIFISQIKNSQASTDHLRRARNTLIGFSIAYLVYALIFLIIILAIVSNVDTKGAGMAVVLFLSLGMAIFLTPRIIAIVRTKPMEVYAIAMPYQQ